MISIDHELGIRSREILGVEFGDRTTGFFKTPDPEGLGPEVGKSRTGGSGDKKGRPTAD